MKNKHKMWMLWQQAKSYSQLPSTILRVTDPLAAWMLNTAVTWFGITIENALAERVKVQSGKEVTYHPKYTLARLLSPNFRLIRPPEDKQGSNVFAPLLAQVGKSKLVRRYAYVPPEEKVDGKE